MDRTDAKPLQSNRSSSSVKQKCTAEETKLKNTNYPLQESLSVQESEGASGLYSLVNSDSDLSLRSGSQNDFQPDLKAANSMGSVGDSGFSRLVVELCYLIFMCYYIYNRLGLNSDLFPLNFTCSFVSNFSAASWTSQ